MRPEPCSASALASSTHLLLALGNEQSMSGMQTAKTACVHIAMTSVYMLDDATSSGSICVCSKALLRFCVFSPCHSSTAGADRYRCRAGSSLPKYRDSCIWKHRSNCQYTTQLALVVRYTMLNMWRLCCRACTVFCRSFLLQSLRQLLSYVRRCTNPFR